MRLESDRLHNKTGKYGLNFGFENTSLGKLNAYTYDYSIFDSLKYLSQFADNPNNSSHILYTYISQLNQILKAIAGTTSLTSSSFNKGEIKEAVLSNVNKFLFSISGETENEFNDFVTNSGSIGNIIRLKLDLSKFDSTFTESFIIELDFNGNDAENVLFYVKVENLKIGEQYGTFRIGIIDCFDNGVFIFEKAKIPNWTVPIGNIQKDAYVDLSDLPLLVKVGLVTTEQTEYYLHGTFKYSLYTYGAEIYIDVSDEINPETGMLYVIGYFKISLNYDALFEKYVYHTEFFLDKEQLYVRRWYQSWSGSLIYKQTTFDYFKCTSQQFLDDIIFYIFRYALDSQFLYDQVINNSGSDLPTKPLDFIKQFKNNVSNNTFELTINGAIYSIFTISGTISIKYDNVTNKIVQLNAPLKVAGVISIGVDVSLSENQSSISNIKNRFNLYIKTFNENPNTRNLGNRFDHNDNQNIYTISKKDKELQGMLDNANSI